MKTHGFSQKVLESLFNFLSLSFTRVSLTFIGLRYTLSLITEISGDHFVVIDVSSHSQMKRINIQAISNENVAMKLIRYDLSLKDAYICEITIQICS